MRFRMKKPDGHEYTLDCHPEILLARRVRGRSRFPKIGQKFRVVSKLDGSAYTETLVGYVDKVPLRVLSTWCRGHRSYAMGINPVQRIEALKADAAAGLTGVDYDPKTGDAIFSSRGARKRFCEFHGFKDRNGSYSDPQALDPREREIRGLPPTAEQLRMEQIEREYAGV